MAFYLIRELYLTHDDFVNLLRLDIGTMQGLLYDHAAQIGCLQFRKCAIEAT